MLILALLLGIWSLLRPQADQPLFAALEPLGLRPELFLPSNEAVRYRDARQVEQRYRSEVDALSDQERHSRWQGAPLTDEELWRIASYQQTYNEMGRGERFVQEFLLAQAHQRERWFVSLPLTILSALALAVLYRGREVSLATA